MNTAYGHRPHFSSGFLLRLLLIPVFQLSLTGLPQAPAQTPVRAQGSGTVPPANPVSLHAAFDNARELYRNQLYPAAREEFLRILRVLESGTAGPADPAPDPVLLKGYLLLCELRMEQADLDGAAAAYLQTYPYSPLAPQIRFEQAVLHFDRGEFATAMDLLDRTDLSSLPRERAAEYLFRKGYCQMRTGDNAAAAFSFEKVLAVGNPVYNGPANYYLGYIRYINRDFNRAIPLFRQSETDTRFALLSRYHILESQFMLKNYDYVLENGEALYRQLDDQYKPNAARILSEAYYAANQPEKANYYFELYSLSGTDLSRTDLFYAGMIAYTLNNYPSAASSFSRVASTADSLGQSACYHLAQSYLQMKNKHAAREAFRDASQSSFDRTIQEDAYFNYAKLTFDLNRDIEPFTRYLGTYPEGDAKWDEIQSYIATAFLLNQDYQQAIEALRKIRRVTPVTTRNLQKASFFRGMQLVESGAYSSAVPYFEQSIREGSYNPSLTHLADFWLAECLYRGNQFARSNEILAALQKNNAFRQSEEYPLSVYNMGYNYFKAGDFEKAAEKFTAYLDLPPVRRTFTREAQTRLADSYFMQKDYSRAAELFERIAVEDEYRSLYAPYHAAMAYGLLGQDPKKIALLQEIATPVHSRSPLYSQAVYELGRTLVQNVRDEEAEQVLSRLIHQPGDSTYYYKALLEMGMISSNLQRPDKALEYYETIVERKPVSEEAQSALAGIENIYQARNQAQEFLAYLDRIGMSTVKTAGEKETMLFNSAEQIYLGGNHTAALNALTAFLREYPDGAKSLQARFYIAECYHKLGKYEAAADAYYKVMQAGDGAFSEIATLNYGQLSYRLERYEEAIQAYETLSHIAKLDNNKLEAQIGKMRSYFKAKQYARAIAEANDLLTITRLDESLRREAVYDKAKSHLALGEREPALAYLAELAADPASAEGAESTYLLVLNAYESGDFDQVEQRVFAFSDSRTPQSYWLAKSFIVLGDSYAERDNWEQARATFNSIRENYKPAANDDVIEQVRLRLKKIEETL